MAKVVVYKNKETGEVESLESMLKRFKKKVMNDGILEDYKRKEYYVSKSLRRKLKAIESLKREKRKTSKNKSAR